MLDRLKKEILKLLSVTKKNQLIWMVTLYCAAASKPLEAHRPFQSRNPLDLVFGGLTE